MQRNTNMQKPNSTPQKFTPVSHRKSCDACDECDNGYCPKCGSPNGDLREAVMQEAQDQLDAMASW